MSRSLRCLVMLIAVVALSLAVSGTASAQGAERTPCTIGTPQGEFHGEAITVINPSGGGASVCIIGSSTLTEEFPLASCELRPGVQADIIQLVVTPSGRIILICVATGRS